MTDSRTWVVVLSRQDALAAAAGGFVTTSTGKRPALARMAAGDRLVIYSPRTQHPGGEPLRAVTVIGTVTRGEPDETSPENFRRAARLRVIEPVALADLRPDLPVPLLRFGCFVLGQQRGEQLWHAVSTRAKRPRRRTISKPQQQAVIVSGPVGNDR